MIDRCDPKKAELAGLVEELTKALNHECDRSTEPCATIHARQDALRLFLTNPENWSEGLTLADLGELVDEALSCSCHELRPRFPEGHHPDCDRWDPQESTGEAQEAESNRRDKVD